MSTAESALPVGFIEPTFGQRLTGRLIDGLLFFGALTALRLAVDVKVWAVSIAWWLLYEIVSMSLLDGQTLGKRLVGTRVRTKTGEPLTARHIVIRSLVLGLGYPIWFIIGIPALWGPLHQGMHDRASGTLVTPVRRISSRVIT